MSLAYPELHNRILDLAEGDEQFKEELTKAIHTGLLELQSKYAEGAEKLDATLIQQIRHKIKPTLAMFGFEDIAQSLQLGKEILDSRGFVPEFFTHYQELESQVKVAVKEVGELLVAH